MASYKRKDVILHYQVQIGELPWEVSTIDVYQYDGRYYGMDNNGVWLKGDFSLGSYDETHPNAGMPKRFYACDPESVPLEVREMIS